MHPPRRLPYTSCPFSKAVRRGPGGPALTDLEPLRAILATAGSPGPAWRRSYSGMPSALPLEALQRMGRLISLLGDGGLRALAFSFGVVSLSPGCLLVQQVADLHDVPNDLHWACQILLPCWQLRPWLSSGRMLADLFARYLQGGERDLASRELACGPQAPSGLAWLSFLYCTCKTLGLNPLLWRELNEGQ